MASDGTPKQLRIHQAGPVPNAVPSTTDAHLSPTDLLFRATKNVEHLNRNGALLVEGEVREPKVSSKGHLSFKLADAKSAIGAFMWFKNLQRLPFRVEQGQKVVVTGTITVTQWGNVQLDVTTLAPVGEGAKEIAFRQLRDRLKAQGLFDASRKKPLPALPTKMGIVTSMQGAAIYDVLRRLKERMPRLSIVLRPTKVQGDGAAADIAEAIRAIDALQLDVLLVVRGGGGAEDLSAYNSEPVVMAIAHARTPIVVGVGHESDTTLADWVADQRASTPTHAAEVAVPRIEDVQARLVQQQERLHMAMRSRSDRARMLLLQKQRRLSSGHDLVSRQRRVTDAMAARLLRALERRQSQAHEQLAGLSQRLALQSPQQVLQRSGVRLAEAQTRLSTSVRRLRTAKQHDLAVKVAQLHALSPLAILLRGYSVTTTMTGQAITDANTVAPGDALSVRLAKGTLQVTVAARHTEEDT